LAPRAQCTSIKRSGAFHEQQNTRRDIVALGLVGADSLGIFASYQAPRRSEPGRSSSSPHPCEWRDVGEASVGVISEGICFYDAVGERQRRNAYGQTRMKRNMDGRRRAEPDDDARPGLADR
jgi:hypothetical protein